MIQNVLDWHVFNLGLKFKTDLLYNKLCNPYRFLTRAPKWGVGVGGGVWVGGVAAPSEFWRGGLFIGLKSRSRSFLIAQRKSRPFLIDLRRIAKK